MPWRKRAGTIKTGNWTKLNTRKKREKKLNMERRDLIKCFVTRFQDKIYEIVFRNSRVVYWRNTECFRQFKCRQHWLFSTNHVGMEFLWNGGMFLEFLIQESKIMMGLSRLKYLLLLIQSNWFNWQKLVRGLNKLLWLRFYWWSINHNTLKLNQVKRACKRSFQFYKDNKRSCINSTYTARYYLTWIATFKGTNK